MKLTKLSVLLLLVITIFTSCEKETEEEVNVFKFTIGTTVNDFSSNIETGTNLYGDKLIKATKEDNLLTITLDKWTAGTFTEENYNDGANGSDYNISYYMDNKTYRYDKNRSNSNFEINITQAGTTAGSKIKGTFKAYLFYNSYIGTTGNDSIEITNGTFTTLLD